MIALLVMFTVIGLAGLMMMLASSHMQSTRINMLEREADAAMTRANAVMAERAGFTSYRPDQPLYRDMGTTDDRR